MKIDKDYIHKIMEWKNLTELLKMAKDTTICPVCEGPFICCDCVFELAQEILEELLKELFVNQDKIVNAIVKGRTDGT